MRFTGGASAMRYGGSAARNQSRKRQLKIGFISIFEPWALQWRKPGWCPGEGAGLESMASKARGLVDAGAVLAPNPKAAASNRDTVITMLADDAALKASWTAPKEYSRGCGPARCTSRAEFRWRVLWKDQREPEWDHVLHPDDRPLWQQRWQEATLSGSQFQLECRLYDHHSGSYRWHLARAVPVDQNNADGKRWYGTCTDIEEQKRAEELIRQRQRLESTGLLAGGVAHDFNNLMTGVLGNASLLLDDRLVPQSAAPMLRDIVESAERAAHLTRQMLAYAGKGSFVFERLDLSTQIRNMVRLMYAAVPKKVKLELALATGLPGIEADVTQIQQVIMNLVVNAAEAFAAERPGSVTIATRSATIPPVPSGVFVPEPPPPGRYVVLEIRDDADGMTPEVFGKIFDPFFSTKFMGRGLGLPAVLGIVRSHRGAILAETSLEKGSTFRVFFPAVGGETSPTHPEDTSREFHRTTVLIIDDEAIVRRTARHALESRGYAVAEAGNGAEGLDLFRADPTKYQMILLDRTMPVMDGEEALPHLHAIQPRIPIVLSSGYDEREALRHFPGGRLSGFIQKPYTTAALLALVENVLKRGTGSGIGPAGS